VHVAKVHGTGRASKCSTIVFSGNRGAFNIEASDSFGTFYEKNALVALEMWNEDFRKKGLTWETVFKLKPQVAGGKSRENQYSHQRNQAIKRNLLTVFNIVRGVDQEGGESSLRRFLLFRPMLLLMLVINDTCLSLCEAGYEQDDDDDDEDDCDGGKKNKNKTGDATTTAPGPSSGGPRRASPAPAGTPPGRAPRAPRSASEPAAPAPVPSSGGPGRASPAPVGPPPAPAPRAPESASEPAATAPVPTLPVAPPLGRGMRASRNVILSEEVRLRNARTAVTDAGAFFALARQSAVVGDRQVELLKRGHLLLDDHNKMAKEYSVREARSALDVRFPQRNTTVYIIPESGGCLFRAVDVHTVTEQVSRVTQGYRRNTMVTRCVLRFVSGDG
jgi:hypothetical protein